MAKKRKSFNYCNYYPVYYWMSQLSVIQLDTKGKPKTDKDGEIIYSNLSGVAKELYAIVFRFSVGANGWCTMGYDSFVKITGASKSTIIRGLNQLEVSGLIKINTWATKQNSKGQDIITRSKYYKVKREPLEDLEAGLGLGDEITKKLEAEYEPEDLSDDENFTRVF